MLVPGVVLPWVQDFALPLIDCHEVPVSPFLQPVKVPLDGSKTLWCIGCSSQFGVISKLAESPLCPIIQMINEDVKEDQFQYQPLRYTASYWPPAQLHATGCHPLGPSIQPVFNPLGCLLIQPISHKLVYEYLTGDIVKSFSEVQVDSIDCSPLIYQTSYFIVES